MRRREGMNVPRCFCPIKHQLDKASPKISDIHLPRKSVVHDRSKLVDVSRRQHTKAERTSVTPNFQGPTKAAASIAVRGIDLTLTNIIIWAHPLARICRCEQRVPAIRVVDLQVCG
eukprot:scaffold64498_cov16-Tisochrysis_lutea.AAC.1